MSLFADIDEPDFSDEMPVLPRSRLFILEPLGVGTPNQESLLSLLIRTSHAHAVSPRLLIKQVFAQTDPAIARLPSAAFFQRLSGTMNGLGKYAEIFVSGMEKLTGQPSLRHLTMLPWRDLFPHNGQGLLARRPRWCPHCLQEQKLKGEAVAFPLVWSLEAYSVCSAHRVLLEHRCSACGSVQRFIPYYPDLAVCGRCGNSLAHASASEKPQQFQFWVAEAVGDMVGCQSGPGFSPSLERFREFVREQVAAHAGGNRAAFCRAIGLNEFGVSGWLNKGERPSAAQFLALCYGITTMPGDVFRSSCSLTPVGLRLQPGGLRDRVVCPRLAPERRMALKETLQGCLEFGDGRSVSAIAKKLGLGRTCLRYWFPDLCKLLSEQHRSVAKTHSEEHQQRQCAVVENVIRNIRAEGNRPSKRRVDQLLRSEGGISLSQPHLMGIYRKAVCDDTS